MKKIIRVASLFLSAVLICSVLTACTKTMSYSGSALTSAKVGDPYTATVAAVKDIESVIYAKTGGNLPGGLTLSSAGEITGTPTAHGSFSFTVKASAKGYKDAEAQFSIEVAERLSLSYTASALAGGNVGETYSASVATATGADLITYTRTGGSLPAGLTLNTSGAISGTPEVNGSFSFTVTASAAGYNGKAADFSIAISKSQLSYPTPGLTNGELPGGKLGIEYKGEGGAAVSVQTATGPGTPSITYAVTSGSLPAGLSLINGIITGTPTAHGGPFNFTVTASATGYDSAAADFLITVSILDLSYEGGALSAGKVESAYSDTVATATAPEGTPTFRYELKSGSLPGGLNLDSVTGAVTGMPTTAGTFTFTVTASDANSYYASADAEFTIVISPIIKYSGKALNAKVNEAPSLSVADATVIGVAVQTSVTYTLKSGTLPTPLILNSNGTITGTPTAITSSPVSFTVTASAAGCESVDANFTISVSDLDTIFYSAFSLPNGQLTVEYKGAGGAVVTVATATAPGNPPITYSVAATDLPGGLTLSGSGNITGTPTEAGTFTFTVTASATGYNSGAADFTIIISNLGTISYIGRALAEGVQNQQYAGDSVGTATGASSITYTITSGSLPTGLELAEGTGAIIGTPTVTGQFSFTVTASAANYASANAQFTIKISPPEQLATSYYFEAEYILLEWEDAEEEPQKRKGCAYSGGGPGYGMLYEDIEKTMMISLTESITKTGNARRVENDGYFITSMYDRNVFIDFEIYSDRAVTDAQLYASLSAEFFANALRLAPNNTTVDGENYWGFLFETIHLGATPYDHFNNPFDERLDYGDPGYTSNIINYAPIVILNTLCSTPGDPIMDFKEYSISMNVSLCAGINIIRLRTNNSAKIDGSGGGMGAVAPMVDYIKVVTDANLRWNKKFEGNLEFAYQ